LDPSSAPQYVDHLKFNKWRASCQLLMMKIGESENPWKKVFDGETENNLAVAQIMQAKLEAIREAITNDLVQFEDLKVTMENQQKTMVEKKQFLLFMVEMSLLKSKPPDLLKSLGMNKII
jgi:hypothetical protein